MKKIINYTISLVFITIFLCVVRYWFVISTVENAENTINKSVEKAILKNQENAKKLGDESRERERITKLEAYNAALVDVNIPGKSIKECMNFLGINEINESVIKCTKGKVLKVRRDKIDEVRQENGL